MLGLVAVGGYFLYEWWVGQQAAAATTTTPTPGTTPTMTQAQTPTSVSTAPTTTPATTTTTTGTAAPTATDLQNQLNQTLAGADAWNYAYAQLTGVGIDRRYGFSFDQVYGSIVNGVRNNGQLLTANAFLTMPAAFGFTTPAKLSGLGAIAQFYTPVVAPQGSMIYRAQHPSPYRYPMAGLGAFTQATGFEKALWGGRSLRRLL